MLNARWSRSLFGPMRRTARTGVPADHFPPARLMFDHGDGETVLVADGPEGVVLDKIVAPPEAFGVEGVLESWWFPDDEHRQALIDGLGWALETTELTPETRQRFAAEAEANGGIREADGGIDGGVSALLATREPEADLALHDKMTGPHTHDHSHGDGTTHSHGHFHSDSNVHNHSHGAAVDPTVRSAMSKLSEADRRRLDGANEITDPEALAALVASAFEARGGADAWAAKRAAQGLTAAADGDGNVVGANWHAYLCAEGIRTDDGRELEPGSCRFPDLPVSIRLLIEDEGGHWGAVTCGRIDVMDRKVVGALNMIYSEGQFGSDPNGQLAELMVEEQTQRFVSIDPRDASAEWIEVEIRRGDDEVMYDCWLRISDCVVGAATIVAMPALPQAVITLAGIPLPEAPIANATAPPGLGEMEGEAAAAAHVEEPIAASGAPIPRPHREWFDDPGFHLGDPRLVLQSDDKSFACPLTVGEPDPTTGLRRVFGHVAWWNCDHTAFPGKRIKPPKSESGYAYFNNGPGVVCADGSTVHGVGQITMGTGHAPTFRVVGDRKVTVGYAEAKAHYDGGYGAVQVCDVRAGQDDFGPWVAGWVRGDITEKHLAEFMALNLSGDWREIGTALDMVAVLAVPVPGFPIKRAMTASGAPELDEATTIAGFKDDRCVSLVAAGVVRRVDPVSRISVLEQTLSAAINRIEAMEAVEHHRAETERLARRARFGL